MTLFNCSHIRHDHVIIKFVFMDYKKRILSAFNYMQVFKYVWIYIHYPSMINTYKHLSSYSTMFFFMLISLPVCGVCRHPCRESDLLLSQCNNGAVMNLR